MKQKTKEKMLNLAKRLDTQEARDFVEKRLNKIQTLPTEGYCLGQAVSSAIIEYLHLENEISPVYNDIDVFKADATLFAADNTGIADIEEIRKVEESSEDQLFLGIKNAEEYIGLSSGIFHKYSILSTETDGLINIVDINIHGKMSAEFPPREYDVNLIKIKESAIANIIDSFDINTTKTGFIIEEKNSKLSIDQDFLLFLATKQIEIDNMPHPVNAFLRALKKQEEMGVYFDIEKYIKPVEGMIDIIDNVSRSVNTEKIDNPPAELKALSKKRTISSSKYLNLYKKYAHHFKNSTLVNENDNFIVTSKNPGLGLDLVNEFIEEGGDFIFGTNEDSRRIVKKSMRKIALGEHQRIIDPPYPNLPKITKEEEAYFKYFLENTTEKGNPSVKNIDPEVIKEIKNKARKGVVSGGMINTAFSLPELLLSVKSMKKSTLKTTAKVFDLQMEYKGEIADSSKRLYTDRIKFITQARKEHLTPEDIEKYLKEMKKILHSNHIIFIKRLLEDVKNIKKLTKILSIINKESKNSMDFIGKIETDIIKFISDGGWDQFLEPDFVAKMMKKERDLKKIELREDIPKNQRFFKSENFTAELLTTGIQLENEGEMMNHCVGGYTTQVKNKSSLIFKIFGEKENGEKVRATMELSRLKENVRAPWEEDDYWYDTEGNIENDWELNFLEEERYKISQIYGKNNKQIEVEENMMKLLLEINKTFKVVEGELTVSSLKKAIGHFFETPPTDFKIEEIIRKTQSKIIPSILDSAEKEIYPQNHLVQ